MKDGSWASYREAMPPECFGEPDYDEPPEDPDPNPTVFTVTWYAYDDYVPQVRFFDGSSHGSDTLAYQAACRWCRAMENRYGKDNVRLEVTTWEK